MPDGATMNCVAITKIGDDGENSTCFYFKKQVLYTH